MRAGADKHLRTTGGGGVYSSGWLCGSVVSTEVLGYCLAHEGGGVDLFFLGAGCGPGVKFLGGSDPPGFLSRLMQFLAHQ